jgi:hypothetical protein
MAPALLPPHLRPRQGAQYERPQYTPSPLSHAGGQYGAGQFDDADDLPAATARMSIGNPTPPASTPDPKVSPAHTGATDRTTNPTARTQATVGSSGHPTESTNPSTTLVPSGTPVTPASTPFTESSKSSKPVNIKEELEALPLTSFYVRPGYGKEGRPITVESNYFAVRAIGPDGRGKIIQ